MESFEDMKKCLDSNARALCSLDSSFCLELAYLSAPADDELTSVISEKMIDVLPSEKQRRSLTQALASLQKVLKKDMVQMSAPAMRSLANSVEEIVAGMLQGQGPDGNLSKSHEFCRKLMHRLSFFISDGDGPDVVYGAAAMKAKFARMT